jgi:hypothetical protein
MKSTNGGDSWFPITNGLDVNQEFYKIIVDKFRPDTVYLATEHMGVYISEDGGAYWQPWNDGLTDLHAGTNANNVANCMMLSVDGCYLYFGSIGSGVFRRMIAEETSNVEVEGDIDLSEECNETIRQLMESLYGTIGKQEFKLKIIKQNDIVTTEINESIGDLTEDQLSLWYSFVDIVEILVEEAEDDNVELEIEIEHELEIS